MNGPPIATADDVRALSRRLYGAVLDAVHGVLHVVAIGGDRRVIRIGDAAPKSEWDFAVLQLARARVDAIVVSGRVIREEPELRYVDAPGFAAYRRALGGERPRLLVLTHGELPIDHPVWSSDADCMVLTDGRPRLPSHVEIVRDAAPSIDRAIECLRTRGARGVSLEPGPSTVVPLYRRRALDELMLSVFEGPLEPAAQGGAFVDPGEHSFVRANATAIDEPSGRWHFERWLPGEKSV